MNNNIEISNTEITLIQAGKIIIPWWDRSDNENILKTQTEEDPSLDAYYLFPLTEITVNNEIENIPEFINERYHSILSASNTAGISVAIIINSKKGNNSIYLGFKKDEKSEKNPELFKSIINGILPGKNIKYNENINISSLVKGLEYGGVVTGVPIIKKGEEKLKFNISSVVRGLYGKDYTLVIISEPVNEKKKKKSLIKLINLRDELHSFVKKTVGKEIGIGTSKSKNEQITEGISNTEGEGFALMFSENESETISKSIIIGETISDSHSQSESLSVEQQNGYALELEKITDSLIERMIEGFNSGFWETAITFATKDKITSDILGGSFIGELSNSNDKLSLPPKLYTDELDKKKMLFLPKVSSSNPIFPKTLASYLTSEELALISSPPTESLPGYEIKKMPPLALSDINENGEIKLGNIADHGNSIKNSFITLSKKDLNKHIFVCGLTGSGKTTTVKNILKNLINQNIPFLVLELAKRDYRQLLGDDAFVEQLNVFTVGDATVSPIRINPFYIQKGVHPLVHIDYLKAIFNASFSLYGPMPHIVEKCLHNIYIKKGWNLTTGIHPNFLDEKGIYDESRYDLIEHYYYYPTVSDLKDEVNNYVKNELEYKGELRDNIRTAIIARLDSLCVGAKGLMFNTYDFYPLEKLLENNTILEMENLADDDDKAFFVGLILVLISEYRQRDNPAIKPGQGDKGLQHFMVIEEAHRLLKNVTTERTSEMIGNPKGKAVEAFCNVISEMRSLGQGVCVVEQIPTKISPDVIKNSNTKIVHRLVAKDDQSLLAGSLSISDQDALYLNRLITGNALCHKEGMARPVECSVIDNIMSKAISDEKIYRKMKKHEVRPLHSPETYELALLLKENGKELIVRLLNSLCTIESKRINELVNKAEEEIHKLLVFNNIHTRFNKIIFADYITKQIFELLNKGVYCIVPKFPENLKQTLFNVINKSDEIQHRKLVELFKEYWKVNDLKLFINELVGNLSIKYLIDKGYDLSNQKLKSTISSFFLIYNEQLIIDISQMINGLKGDVNG